MSPLAPDGYVGRARELDALTAALDAAQQGHGRVVLLIGDPGIGKTRTAEQVAHHASERGFEVLRGRCFEGEGAPALWPWVQVLADYASARDGGTLSAEFGPFAADVAAIYPELRTRLPDLGPAPEVDAASARFRMFEGIARALTSAAARRPIALFLDDLHGADLPSALLLQYLARNLRDRPVVIVGGLRTVAYGAEHPLAGVLGALVREQVVEMLPLGGLSDREVGELLDGVLGRAVPRELATAVRARTDGNPFYVKEIARSLASSGATPDRDVARPELPDAIRLAIGHNLGELGRECRRLLSLAAIFGREFQIEVLARASALERPLVMSLLDEAERKRFVETRRSHPGGRRFVHALFAETLAEELTAAERTALHRRAAEALASDPRAAERAAEIAQHWLAAGADGDVDQAVEWSSRAAERASRALAYEEAARLYRAALGALDVSSRPADAQRCRLLLGLGEECKRAGDAVAARAAFGAAAALARRLDSAESLTRAALGFARGVTFGAQGKAEPAELRLLGEAIDSWRGRDSGLHASALARLGVAHFLHDSRLVGDLLERATAMARRVGDAAALRYALAADLTAHQARQDPAQRRALAAELVELATSARDLEALAVARLWRVVHSAELGDITAARREQSVLVQLAAGLRQPVYAWYAALTETLIATHEGRLDDAERAAAAALRAGEASLQGHARGYFVAMMFVIGTLRGEPGEFAAEFRRVYESHPDPRTLSPLIWAASERGDASEVRRLLPSACDEFDLRPREFDIFLFVNACFAAEGCAVVHDLPRAERLYALLSTARLPFVVWGEAFALGPLDYFRGRLAATLGRADVAVSHFEKALSLAVECGALASLPRTQRYYALLLQARGAPGDAERAASLLGAALATARTLGMAGLAARIEGIDASRAEATAATGPHVFRREGSIWTIASGGRQIVLRDMRGLLYLAALLREPGRELHAIDLVRVAQSPTPTKTTPDASLTTERGLGGRDAPLDGGARAAYRRRLLDLEEEVARAEQLRDLGRRSRAVVEKELLLAELSADARSVRSGSHEERARVAVTKAIKSAIDRIAASHPELGAHLSATIRRGYFCSYVPDPRAAVDWTTG